MIFSSRISPGEILLTDANNVFHLASASLIEIMMSPSSKPFSKFELLFKATVYVNQKQLHTFVAN